MALERLKLKFHSLTGRITSELVRKAFLAVRRNRGAAGLDKVSIKMYEANLEISPNRFNSLYGAGRAAELAGNSQKAKSYYSKLLQISARADSSRPEIEQAKKFLAKK